MGTLNAFYVRVKDDHNELRAIAAVREHFADAEIEVDDGFLAAELPDEAFEPPEGVLLELSERLNTDVYWLGFQSVVDAFDYFHWRGGQLVRSLVYGCFTEERTWERADGEPEEWEAKVFFDAATLQRRLGVTNDKTEKEQLERIWSDSLISPGQTEPALDGRECARKVAKYFGFPGWASE